MSICLKKKRQCDRTANFTAATASQSARLGVPGIPVPALIHFHVLGTEAGKRLQLPELLEQALKSRPPKLCKKETLLCCVPDFGRHSLTMSKRKEYLIKQMRRCSRFCNICISITVINICTARVGKSRIRVSYKPAIQVLWRKGELASTVLHFSHCHRPPSSKNWTQKENINNQRKNFWSYSNNHGCSSSSPWNGNILHSSYFW